MLQMTRFMANRRGVFHGYYGHYCYLPLYIVSGMHVLTARLRPSNIDASKGSVEELAAVVARIRARWPGRTHLDSWRRRLLPRRYHGMVRSAGPALYLG